MKLANVCVDCLQLSVIVDKYGTKDKCRCECKEDLINKMVCDKGFIWNPSNCQ